MKLSAEDALLEIRQADISKDNKEVRSIIDLATTCPDLIGLEDNDFVAREKIINCLKEMSKYDLSVIRKAMSVSEETNNIKTLNSFFLLNKYLFNVPEKGVSNNPYFGGRIYYDEKSGLTNWLHPFSIDTEGQVRLTGRLGAYFGQPYMPTKAFDWFYLTYGLRNSK